VTNSWRIGGVQLELREDGTFSIYQPDSNRVMPQELALQVALTILGEIEGAPYAHAPAVESAQSTVGGGVISTSDGPKLTDTEQQADRNALETSRALELQTLVAEAQEQGLRREADGGAGRRETLGQMTAEAHADGTDETVTEFGPARTEKPKPPVKRRPGRPRKTT
jgi:hypothetical protein